MKTVSIIALCCFMFFLGFLVARQTAFNGNTNTSFDMDSQLADVDENQGETDNSVSERTRGLDCVKTNKVKASNRFEYGWGPELTEEDKKLLEEHVYGQWQFSERLIELDESKNSYYDTDFNFSDEGVETLKGIVIRYDTNAVEKVKGFGQAAFSNPRDLYLYASYGGMNMVTKPVFHVEKLEGNEIYLRNIYVAEGYTVQFQEVENLVKVYYNLGYNVNSYPSSRGYYLGSSLFVDPNDTETLYLDFCGLWKMERNNINYRMNVKSPY